jgi:1,4-dihydroxy-2-naphthoyl-CoA hydrolase
VEAIEALELAGGLGALNQRMGIKLTEATPERVVATMPVEGNTQSYGLLHGGASCVLAETLGSVGAALHGLRTSGRLPVGVEINASHHKSARRGVVTGVATPLHLGASIATYQIVISDEAGDRVCTARLTCFLAAPGAVRPGRPDGSPSGS